MKILKKNKPLTLISIIIILLIIGIGISTFYFFQSRSSQKTQNTTEPTAFPTQSPLEVIKIEEDIKNTIDSTVTDYLNKTYPEAENIELQTETIGRGYGIINTTFIVDGSQNQRKIYLKLTNSNWSVLEESEDQISCETVQALNDPTSILLSYCR